jgi:hypothetical protein
MTLKINIVADQSIPLEASSSIAAAARIWESRLDSKNNPVININLRLGNINVIEATTLAVTKSTDPSYCLNSVLSKLEETNTSSNDDLACKTLRDLPFGILGW